MIRPDIEFVFNNVGFEWVKKYSNADKALLNLISSNIAPPTVFILNNGCSP